MTSSLVGSEMCIRDRSERGDPMKHKKKLPAQELPPGRNTQPASTRRIFAVSYTHLTLPTICSV
eukprot:9612358-Prorocentrum_lima.AAC.1